MQNMQIYTEIYIKNRIDMLVVDTVRIVELVTLVSSYKLIYR